jgi:eukaryotic-like serine/threonine-protein kinase
VPEGRIVSQEPRPGSVTRRPRAIRVWLSAGSRAPVVPDLIGSSERAAILRLQGDGLNLTRTVEIRSADFPADTVVAQWPSAKVKAADVVLLVNRSERGATYVMPDVIGLDGSRAADLLRGWGFRASVVGSYPYPGIAANIVLRQSPRAGFQVAPGDAISLEVSR